MTFALACKLKKKTNKWNKFRYSVHSAYYDWLVGSLESGRKRAIEILDAKNTDDILIVGAGTGLDLKYLRAAQSITATDITPAMIARLKKRIDYLHDSVKALVMDGQNLEFEDNKFDCIILNLVLTVVADPKKCLAEAERVLKSGGKIVVFDKFLGDNETPSIIRRLANSMSTLLFSELNRRFSDILAATNMQIELEEPSMFGGLFRILRLRKIH
jgi:ubiquinone/menaquinone biosynthesis C-methylase UbiE